MNEVHENDKILILDFGSQVTQLIARRVRENGVYSEIFPYTKWKDCLEKIKPKGIILSGGPASTIDGSSPQVSNEVINFGVPILGICYGQQTLCSQLGGKVEHSTKREFGRANINIIGKSKFFSNFSQIIIFTFKVLSLFMVMINNYFFYCFSACMSGFFPKYGSKYS